MIRTILASSLAVSLVAAAAPAQVSFERLAPENSVLVVGVHNATTTQARLQRTALHDLWRSDEMRDLRRQLTEDLGDGFEKALREAGIDREDLVWPTGAAGFAVFPVIDPERGMPGPAYVAYADYGDGADSIERIVRTAIERGEREGALTRDERDILGRTVVSLTFERGDDDDDWGMDDDDWGFDEPFMGPGGGGPPQELQRLHIVREGGAFLLCNDLGSITEMLDRVDQNRGIGLADRADYRAAIDKLGTNDVYAVVLTRDLIQLATIFDPTGGMMGMVPPILRNLFGEISALSTSLLFDAPDGMIRNNMVLYMPRGKQGITSLMDVSRSRGRVPAFVGADVYSYGSMHFNFGGLADAARQFVQSVPMLQMWGVEQALADIEPTIRQITATLGDQVHIVSSLTRPIDADSAHTLVAVESTNPQQFETLFGGFAPQMGLEGRDFLGHRIYSVPMGIAMPGVPEMSVGIGAGHVFFGSSLAVEQALRGAAEPDRAGGLAEEPQFSDAVRRLPDVPLVSWGYTDIITTIEAMVKTMQVASRQMREEWREQFPEWADEVDDEAPQDKYFDRIDYDLLRRYIGPSVMWWRSTEDGFVGTTLYLSAEEAGR